MYYSVKELRDKLERKVLGLGISPKFKENPAYASILAEIDGLIAQMNMFNIDEAVMVREDKGSISFSWNSTNGSKYFMDISCANPNTFKCVRTEEKRPYLGKNGQNISEKNVIEEIATIDQATGVVTLVTNGSMIDDYNCEKGKCNNSTWSERKRYTSYGVMSEREYKGFPLGELSKDFDKADVDSMLYIPRQAFDSGVFWHDNYDTRLFMTRDMLDTARVVSEERKKGFRYAATVPLNQEHGLRDMILQVGAGEYPQDIVIPPLSKDKVDAMLNRESNPKIREGLRAFAEGRDKYHYSTAEDKNFVYEGITGKAR